MPTLFISLLSLLVLAVGAEGKANDADAERDSASNNELKFLKDWPKELREDSMRRKRDMSHYRQRVVGGVIAEENKFPWVVYFHAISKKRKNGSEEFGSVTNFCGGSLVHPR